MMVKPNVGSHGGRRPGAAERGFTIVELLIVVAVLGILAAVALQQTTHYAARSRRVEAYLVLNALHDAQLAHRGEHGVYAGTFSDLSFSLDGGSTVSPTEIKGRVYTFTISQPWGPGSYYCMASANIDDDDWPDVIVITDGEPGDDLVD